ncbi:MAG: hypothetical protein Q9163_002792 [Psora crenata]
MSASRESKTGVGKAYALPKKTQNKSLATSNRKEFMVKKEAEEQKGEHQGPRMKQDDS